MTIFAQYPAITGFLLGATIVGILGFILGVFISYTAGYNNGFSEAVDVKNRDIKSPKDFKE